MDRTPEEQLEYIKELERRLKIVDYYAEDLRKFIYANNLQKHFKVPDIGEETTADPEGFFYLDSIDIACNLDDEECFDWEF
jgi:hypothetical protein